MIESDDPQDIEGFFSHVLTGENHQVPHWREDWNLIVVLTLYHYCILLL